VYDVMTEKRSFRRSTPIHACSKRCSWNRRNFFLYIAFILRPSPGRW